MVRWIFRVKIKLFFKEGQIFPGGSGRILIFFPENVEYWKLLYVLNGYLDVNCPIPTLSPILALFQRGLTTAPEGSNLPNIHWFFPCKYCWESHKFQRNFKPFLIFNFVHYNYFFNFFRHWQEPSCQVLVSHAHLSCQFWMTSCSGGSKEQFWRIRMKGSDHPASIGWRRHK